MEMVEKGEQLVEHSKQGKSDIYTLNQGKEDNSV